MDRPVETEAAGARIRHEGQRPQGWVGIDLADGATASLVRFELMDGAVVERPYRGRRMMLRVPSSVARVLVCGSDGRPLPVGRWRVRPVGPARALAESLCLTLEARVARPLTWATSLHTAVRLVARGEWREIGRRLRGPGAGEIEVDPGPSRWRPPDAWAPRASGPPRVLCVTPGLALDGATLSLAELSTGLAQRAGFQVEVLSAAGGPASPRFSTVRSRVDPSIGVSALDLRSHDAQVDGMRAVIRAGMADLVVGNTVRAFGAIEAAWRESVPSLWIVRESEPWPGILGDLHADVLLRARQAFDLAWRVVFVADATRSSWRRVIDDERAVTIRNTLEAPGAFRDPQARARLRQAEGWAAEEFVVLSVGTICRRKAQADLLAAFARVDASVAARLSIRVVGALDPDYGGTFRAALSALPDAYRARVRIDPPTERIGEYYSAADAYVGCSIFESYPRTILEALAAGLPIVTTPVFGVREQVEEGRSALFFAPGDVAALARGLERLVADPALRQSLREGACARAAALPRHEAMIDAYAALVRAGVAMRST